MCTHKEERYLGFVSGTGTAPQSSKELRVVNSLQSLRYF